MLNLLTNLNAQYPGKVYLMAHGYGAIAAGEALRLAGTNNVVKTYIALQSAVAAHTYDGSLPPRMIPTNLDDLTPDRYAAYFPMTSKKRRSSRERSRNLSGEPPSTGTQSGSRMS